MKKYLFLFNSTSSAVINGNLLFEMGVDAENPADLKKLAFLISWCIARRVSEMPESTRSKFEKEVLTQLEQFFSDERQKRSLLETLDTFGLLVTDSFADAVQVQSHGL